MNQLLLARDQGKVTGLVFVDLRKAFDRVEHQTLIDLLSTIRISGTALKLMVRRLLATVTNGFLWAIGQVLNLCAVEVFHRAVCLAHCCSSFTYEVCQEVSLFLASFSPMTSCYSALDFMRVRLPGACQTTSLHAWLTQRGLQMNVNKSQAMFILPRKSNRATTIDINITCGSRSLVLCGDVG